MGHFVTETLAGRDYGPRAARRERQYRAYIPDEIADLDYAPGRDAALLIAEAASQITAFDVRSSGSAARVARLIGLLSRSEGIGSSTIENYSAPLAKVVAAEATGDRPHTATTPVVILDGIESVTFAIDALGDPTVDVTPEAIESVQRRLMRHSPRQHIGLRTGYVQIGGRAGDPDSADFIPPPASEVPRLLEDLCTFINRSDGDIHPVARAAIAHAQFETIHPFPDGNGRTGRALLQAMLHRDGMLDSSVLPVSLSIARDDNSKDMYVGALTPMRTEGRQPNFDATIEAFAWLMSDASATAMRMIAETDGAYEAMVDTARRVLRSDSHGLAIIDFLSSRLGATVNSMASELSADPNAVRRTLKVLEDAGVVASRSAGKYGRVFHAPSLLAVVEDAALMPPLTEETPVMPGAASTFAVTTGQGSGRPRKGPRCGVPLRTGGTCMRPEGHGNTGHRSKP